MSRRRVTISRPNVESLARRRHHRRPLDAADRRPQALNHPRDNCRHERDQRRTHRDADRLSASPRALIGGEPLVAAALVDFALPERGAQHSGFFARLEEAGRRQSDRHRDKQARRTRSVRHDENDRDDGGDCHHDESAASAATRTRLSNVLDALQHRRRLSYRPPHCASAFFGSAALGNKSLAACA